MTARRMDPCLRKRIMSSIRSSNTRPELALRSALWKAGVRGWRCHLRDLPGRPDLAFTRWRVAIHVDGVWWHGRPDYFEPGSRGPYWDKKIGMNRRRDRRVDRQLRALGWRSIRIWDVDVLKNPEKSVKRVIVALRSRGWNGPLKLEAAS